MTPPVPKFTLENLQGAIGDVMRASAAWGQADARGESHDQHIPLVMQCIAQLLTLCMQQEATPEQVMGCIAVQ